ncbi:hypothetical protein PMZ80_006801 [Knufia obscura]|uniref:Uncharacterized protein n=1 Tax=Knufia obscura TaxID=1635080 RepID=A0ABR0RLN0_9EURO|nr:hypothetical protein PMZ80_006801 [Knufia obscura]
MPPKKAQAAKAVSKKQKTQEEKQVPDRTKEEAKAEEPEDVENPTNPKDEAMDEEPKDVKMGGVPADDMKPEEAPGDDEQAQAGQKRKSPPTSASKEKPPKKEPRQGSRASGRTAGGGTGKDVTSKQILNFLLSEDSLQYCFPSDELDAARSGKFKKTYSLTPPSLFTPFEHLITASLLSKPLSHTLGMRSVRTLLNEPYSFSTPGDLKKAGEDKIWNALEEARTQHRQKTASYLYDMGTQYADPNSKDDGGDKGDSDEMLELATAANEGGVKATIEHVKSTVKGMGVTGAEIFCRRVQACEGWGEALWPYADSKSFDALRELGVKVGSADELQEMIERDVDFDKVGSMGLTEEKKGVDDKDYEVQVAVEFVTVLERAVGCSLEQNVPALRKAAAEWK